jgi:hypothetical protein
MWQTFHLMGLRMKTLIIVYIVDLAYYLALYCFIVICRYCVILYCIFAQQKIIK